MRFVVVVSLMFSFLWTGPVLAASVEKCSNKSRQCIVVGSHGLVGDNIKVLNEKGQVIATGWVVKRDERRRQVVVSFRKVLRSIKKGYPVIVERSSFDLSWDTSFSN
jgi:hypothetical protein